LYAIKNTAIILWFDPAELHTVLKANVMVRRLKMEVLKDLREKTRTIIPTSCLASSKELSEKLSRVDKSAIQRLTVGGRQEESDDPSIMQLYMLTGVAKLPFVLSHVKVSV
jgi:hypothetical protein